MLGTVRWTRPCCWADLLLHTLAATNACSSLLQPHPLLWGWQNCESDFFIQVRKSLLQKQIPFSSKVQLAAIRSLHGASRHSICAVPSICEWQPGEGCLAAGRILMKPSGAFAGHIIRNSNNRLLPIFLKNVCFQTLLLGAFPWQANDLKQPHSSFPGWLPFLDSSVTLSVTAAASSKHPQK